MTSKLIGLVSAAHLLSHFYQLVLPPIFPLLTSVFGVGYAELGLVASLMYVASGLMQTPAGILVDRLGPSRVLIGGVGLFSASVLLSGLVPGFWWLAPLAILAGLGNAVFHPADYAIMTARVDPRRLGRAFGAHGVAGNLGWVAAPASVLGLTALFGWRAALVILGGVGLAFTVYLLSQHACLERRDQDRPGWRAPPESRPGGSRTARAAGACRCCCASLISHCCRSPRSDCRHSSRRRRWRPLACRSARRTRC